MTFPEDYPQLDILREIARRDRKKVHLVGGFLRDYLLKRGRADFDFAVSSGALTLAREFARRIKGAFVLLDEERGCARVVKKTEEGAVTFDFADYRAKTLKGDLAKRDFTINTLCVDLARLRADTPLKDQILDHKNGMADLKAKRIRAVSATSFRDDPLRILRAFSLKAMLDFRIERETLQRIKKEKDLLSGVSFERVRDELFKILLSPRAAATLKHMDRTGVLERVIPQVHVMYGVHQGGYHHLDVWPHSLETVAQFERIIGEFAGDEDVSAFLNEPVAGERRRYALIKLAALLHDIGKPDTKEIKEDRMSFHGHEHVGKDIVRSVARMLKVSTRERYVLQDLVRWHLRPGYLSNFKSPGRRAVFRFFRDTKGEAVSVLLLSLADQRATRGPLTSRADQKHHEKIVRRLIKEYFEEQKKEPFVRLIDGHDLIKELKLRPSPLFSEILKAVEEKQALGRITTRKEALDEAARIAGEKGKMSTRRKKKRKR